MALDSTRSLMAGDRRHFQCASWPAVPTESFRSPGRKLQTEKRKRKKKTNSESSRWPLLDTRVRGPHYGQGPTGVGIARCVARVHSVPTWLSVVPSLGSTGPYLRNSTRNCLSGMHRKQTRKTRWGIPTKPRNPPPRTLRAAVPRTPRDLNMGSRSDETRDSARDL